MAFPAPAGVDQDADAASIQDVRLDGSVKGVVDDDFEPEPAAGSDVDTGARNRVNDDGNDIDDENVLDDALGDRQLQLAALGVLPELAGMPKREAIYARAARAENTLRGYRSDWTDSTTWCATHDADPMPATPAALTGYLVALAEAGAKVGTVSRRLSSTNSAHASAGHPDPATHPRVMAAWDTNHVRMDLPSIHVENQKGKPLRASMADALFDQVDRVASRQRRPTTRCQRMSPSINRQ